MENTREMSFTPHDDLVQTGAAHTPEQSLNVGVLLGGVRSNPHCFDAHGVGTLLQDSAIDIITVAQQIARGRVPGQCLNTSLASASSKLQSLM
jgi:hypothetical protein